MSPRGTFPKPHSSPLSSSPNCPHPKTVPSFICAISPPADNPPTLAPWRLGGHSQRQPQAPTQPRLDSRLAPMFHNSEASEFAARFVKTAFLQQSKSTRKCLESPRQISSMEHRRLPLSRRHHSG